MAVRRGLGMATGRHHTAAWTGASRQVGAQPAAVGPEILHPGIAHDGDDGRAGSQLFGQPQRGDDVGAGGGAREEAFLPGQPQGHGHGLFGGDPLDPIGDAVLPERHDEARADAVDLVRARPAARQHRGFGRLHGDDP